MTIKKHGGIFGRNPTFNNATITTFKSTGIDDNATSTAMTLDSSGNVLVGTTTILTAETNVEGISLAAGSYGGLLSVSRDGNRAATFNRKTSNGDIVEFRKDGAVVGSIGSISGVISYMVFDPRTSGSGLAGVGQSIRPIDETGAYDDAAITLGSSSYRFKDLYLSGSVYLGGTTSSNALNDYEEGNWTPNDASGAGLSFSNVVGTYTKVGRKVFVVCEVEYPATADSSNMAIGGLPFTPTDTFRFAGSMAYTTSNSAGLAQIVNGSSSTVVFRENGTSTWVVNSQLSSKTCRFTMTYHT